MLRDLQCDPASLAGPIDVRVVKNLRRDYPLDERFVEQMASCHGGIPLIGRFRSVRGTIRVARFLTLLDHDSELTGPFRPHFEDSKVDARVMAGIPYLLEFEHQTSRTLFSDLLPFAALMDDMCLDRGYIDLLCLDFRIKGGPPPVVVWVGDLACDAYLKWDLLPLEDQFDDEDNFENVPWDTFLIPIADTFEAFVDELQTND